MRVTEYLRELWRIAEYRGGAIYRSVYLHDVWVTEVDLRNPPAEHQYVVKSTSFTGETIRVRNVDEAPKVA